MYCRCASHNINHLVVLTNPLTVVTTYILLLYIKLFLLITSTDNVHPIAIIMLKSPIKSCEGALFQAPLAKHTPRPPRPNERRKALEPEPAASRSPHSTTTRTSVSPGSQARRWLAALSKLAKPFGAVPCPVQLPPRSFTQTAWPHAMAGPCVCRRSSA